MDPTVQEHFEIEALAKRMYSECYIGHIPWDKWQQFAAFCMNYAKEQMQQEMADHDLYVSTTNEMVGKLEERIKELEAKE